MRTDITAEQTSGNLEFDLVMNDNMPEVCVLWADRNYDVTAFENLWMNAMS